MERIELEVSILDCQVVYDVARKTNLFWGNETVHELQTLQVLAWTKSHSKQVEFAVCKSDQWWQLGEHQAHVRQLFIYFCTRSLSSGTVLRSVGSNNFIDELANGLLVLAVGLEDIHG